MTELAQFSLFQILSSLIIVIGVPLVFLIIIFILSGAQLQQKRSTKTCFDSNGFTEDVERQCRESMEKKYNKPWYKRL